MGRHARRCTNLARERVGEEAARERQLGLDDSERVARAVALVLRGVQAREFRLARRAVVTIINARRGAIERTC